jgi:hypothetical protein
VIRHFMGGGPFLRRFPGNARSSFRRGKSENEDVRVVSEKKLDDRDSEKFIFLLLNADCKPGKLSR